MEQQPGMGASAGAQRASGSLEATPVVEPIMQPVRIEPMPYTQAAAPLAPMGTVIPTQAEQLQTVPRGEIIAMEPYGLSELADWGGVQVSQIITQEELLAHIEKKLEYRVNGVSWVKGRESECAPQQLFIIREQYNLGATAFIPLKRPLTFLMYKPMEHQPVMKLTMKWRKRSGKPVIKMYDGNNRYLGSCAKARGIRMRSRLAIYNAEGDMIMAYKLKRGLRGEWKKLALTDEVRKSETRHEKIGGVYRKRGKMYKSDINDANTYDILFPNDTSISNRAILLGSLVALDLLWYAKNPAKYEGKQKHRLRREKHASY
jgi:hypothetical protein